MSEYKYRHWCGNCQIRIYEQRHYGRILTWQDCPYTCDYAIAMRCLAEPKGETMDDTISKQALSGCEYWDSESNFCSLHRPSVERQARWKKCKKNLFFPDDDIFTCSECFHNYFKQTNYCPNCGAKMEREQNG